MPCWPRLAALRSARNRDDNVLPATAFGRQIASCLLPTGADHRVEFGDPFEYERRVRLEPDELGFLVLQGKSQRR
jgi:hypothetical protein